MKVLFAASEAVPFVKTGGLADVIGSLPKELSKQGLDVRVILPKYDDIPESFIQKMEPVAVFDLQMGWRTLFCGISKLEHEGIIFYFIDNEFYFKRKGCYGYGDDAERFAFYCRAVMDSLQHIDFMPDIIHCHDWQAGMIPVLYRVHFSYQPEYAHIKTVTTVHNLKYQGVFGKEQFNDYFALGDEHLHGYALEQHGGASFLKGGLLYSDFVTTVSPTYAEEIQTPYYGEHLDSLLRNNSHRMQGILNGLDYEEFDPMTDPHIEVNYRDSLAKKQQNKVKLQERLGLPVNKEVPMIALVTRLVDQKGLSLIDRVIGELMSLDAQWVILGTGEPRFEQLFRWAADAFPDKLSAQILFDEGLARQIYAGSDLFLMPSLFEPCGIGQLIAMRYRSVPIVRETGGLRDTVIPYNEETGEGTGFSFASYNAHDMLYTVERAVRLYRDPAVWSNLMSNIKKKDFSWRKSAQQYAGLYQSLAN
ncbi:MULTISPECIES: glycogen synthase GlgA [unclassified Paenibacillus]|uniref:glycogen synthase GlgA n=1 Tax=unclassified Paenibacillus TaxID=185978 RepID=UPI001AE559E2|nr:MULTISPECIES: glycogen synthase GlgA [unclassified Paenibacillus]MBP1155331.1 starch synthase [Paenibacillus sp. PvP091]MBP1169285.1 starch synthase [Paenibacillus sp. PvR098]MBP2440313.1 starch synthase [Paenibacillus sp. PvP052]